MENYVDDEDLLKEQNLRRMSSKELLIRYGKYKMFLGDETNGASPVAWDIDFDSKLIFNILVERLNENDKNIKKLN